MTRKQSLTFLLVLYAVLSAYMLIRAGLGLPFRMWSGFVHPMLALSCVLIHSSGREGGRRTLVFAVLVIVVTLAAESLGVATGLIFGSYHYTDRFGPLFLGLVPFVIPLVWLNMMYPSYVIAGWIVPRTSDGRQRILGVAALGGLVLTSWDLAVDPGMVYKGHWIWDTPGGYFGIPWSNFFGWWLTTFVTLALYLWISQWISPARPAATETADDRPMLIMYALTGLNSIIGDFLIGLGGPALAGLGAMGVWTIWGWVRLSRHSTE
jgi:putative membrane protein